MYTRNLLEPPEKIIVNNKPVFGSFKDSPKLLDITGLSDPFGIGPLPIFLTKLRIRANISFTFNTEFFFGTIALLDSKYFCFSEVILWDKKTLKKQVYRSAFGFRRFIPKNLEKAVCATYNKNRYIRIGWDKSRNRLSAIFSLKGNEIKNSMSAAFALQTNDISCGKLFSVTPSPTQRRCVATYTLAGAIHGKIMNLTNGTNSDCSTENSIGLFDIRRAYYKLRTKTDTFQGLDFLNGKFIIFKLTTTSYDAIDNDTYNENVLFVDNDMTLLPPITVTRPYGITKKWIIQDTENMVDLSFTPVSDHRTIASIFILRSDSHTIYGSFDGDLRTKDGTIIHLKEFYGLVTHQSLRM